MMCWCLVSELNFKKASVEKSFPLCFLKLYYQLLYAGVYTIYNIFRRKGISTTTIIIIIINLMLLLYD